MKQTDHAAIRQYLVRASSGTGNPGKKMVFNPVTRKFEVRDDRDSGDGVAPITAEDMWSFGGVG